jgi:AhpD family alkylhydroperoxidase
MSRIAIPAAGSADASTTAATTTEAYARARKAAGGALPNLYATLGALAPAQFIAYLNAEEALAAGTLSRQDREVIKLGISSLTGCDYCEAAHSMLGKLAGLSPDVLRGIRAGTGAGSSRHDALLHFVRTLVDGRGTIAAAEVDAIRAAGYTDVQLAEIAFAISLITYTNIFNRINDTDVDFPTPQ